MESSKPGHRGLRMALLIHLQLSHLGNIYNYRGLVPGLSPQKELPGAQGLSSDNEGFQHSLSNFVVRRVSALNNWEEADVVSRKEHWPITESSGIRLSPNPPASKSHTNHIPVQQHSQKGLGCRVSGFSLRDIGTPTPSLQRSRVSIAAGKWTC